MLNPPKTTQIVFKVVIFLLPFLLFGYFTDLILASIIVGLLFILGWNYQNLYRLINWLWYQRDAYPPKSTGLWSDVFDGIYHQQRKHRAKRNELSLLVRRFRKGAESLPDAAVVFNEDRTLVWCNALAQKLLGLKWPEDQGNRIDNFLRTPEFIKYLEAKDYDKPFELESPEDEELVLECRIAPFEKDKWTLIARDVTQVKLMEQMRKDFIANVSHELRTPLTVMRGYLELLGDEDSPEKTIWTKAHKMMSEQTHRMDALVNQLLTLTKLESRQSNIQRTTIDIPDMLNTIKMEAEALSDGKHAISLDVQQGLKLTANFDQMRSAISNLVFNAVRYTPEGETIKLNWIKNSKGEAVFSCEDTGEGISSEHISRLTERFYRVDKARTRDSGGSGLGLSIVKHVLTNHNSKLSIKSKLGKGSTFSFAIPEEFVLED